MILICHPEECPHCGAAVEETWENEDGEVTSFVCDSLIVMRDGAKSSGDPGFQGTACRDRVIEALRSEKAELLAALKRNIGWAEKAREDFMDIDDMEQLRQDAALITRAETLAGGEGEK